MQAVVDGEVVVVGTARWLAEAWALPVDEALAAGSPLPSRTAGPRSSSAGRLGARAVVVGDTVKPEAPEAVRRFVALGLRPVLLTGDNEGAARAVAARVGIDEVHARATPASKLETVRRLQAEGRTVAMVGDGVNDAAALAAADLGIAMGAGTDAAIAASDITVVSGRLTVVADAVRLSGRRSARSAATCSGLRLQRRGDPARDGGPAEPGARGCGDGVLVRLRGDEQPAPASLPGHRRSADGPDDVTGGADVRGASRATVHATCRSALRSDVVRDAALR